MDLRTLEMFQIVGEYSSISKAAQQLYISRQALTETMNKLEVEIGLPLLERSHNGVELTPEGQYLFTKGRSLLSEWQHIQEHLHFIQSKDRSLRLGTNLALVSDSLAYRLVFGNVIPCNVVLYNAPTNDCATMIKTGLLDVGYTLSLKNDPQLETISIESPAEETYVLMSVDHPLANQATIDRHSLKGHRVLFPIEQTYSNQCIAEYNRNADMEVVLVPSVHSIQKEFLMKNAGLVFIPGSALSQFIDNDCIIGKPVRDYPHVMEQAIVYSQTASKELVSLCQNLATYFGNEQNLENQTIDQDGTIRWAKPAEE